MTSEHKKIYKAIYNILYFEWDPIGIANIAPRNKYQNNAWTIFSLFIDGADVYTIAKKLHEIETSVIGITGSFVHCREIGEKIVNLR